MQIKGAMDCPSVLGDRAYEVRRLVRGSLAAVAVDAAGEIVGSVFARAWGTLGCFGPITVHPRLWGARVGQLLLKEVDRYMQERGVTRSEIFTFPDSPKHHHLYMSHGYYAGTIAYVMNMQMQRRPLQNVQTDASGPTTATDDAPSPSSSPAGAAAAYWPVRYSQLPEQQRQDLRETALPRLLERFHPGLDIGCELELVGGAVAGEAPGASGEGLLLWTNPSSDVQQQGQQEQPQAQQGQGGSKIDLPGPVLAAVAVVHAGPGSEAGSDRCLVKFAAAADTHSFAALLNQVQSFAASLPIGPAQPEVGTAPAGTVPEGSPRVVEIEAGVNLGRRQAFACLKAAGFKFARVGLSMSTLLPGDEQPAYNGAGAHMICDFR